MKTPSLIFLLCIFQLGCKPDSFSNLNTATDSAECGLEEGELCTLEEVGVTASTAKAYSFLPHKMFQDIYGAMPCNSLFKLNKPGTNILVCQNSAGDAECVPHGDPRLSERNTGRGPTSGDFKFKRDLYLLTLTNPYTQTDFWVSFKPYIHRYQEGSTKSSRPRPIYKEIIMCEADTSGSQSRLAPETVAGVTTGKIDQSNLEQKYNQLTTIAAFIPGVGAAVNFDRCAAGEISCWDAAITSAIEAGMVLLPVGGQVAKVAFTGLTAVGSVRMGQAAYALSQGQKAQAAAFAFEGLVALSPGIFKVFKVVKARKLPKGASGADDLARAAPNIVNCLGLTSVCDIVDFDGKAKELSKQLEELSGINQRIAQLERKHEGDVLDGIIGGSDDFTASGTNVVEFSELNLRKQELSKRLFSESENLDNLARTQFESLREYAAGLQNILKPGITTKTTATSLVNRAKEISSAYKAAVRASEQAITISRQRAKITAALQGGQSDLVSDAVKHALVFDRQHINKLREALQPRMDSILDSLQKMKAEVQKKLRSTAENAANRRQLEVLDEYLRVNLQGTSVPTGVYPPPSALDQTIAASEIQSTYWYLPEIRQ